MMREGDRRRDEPAVRAPDGRRVGGSGLLSSMWALFNEMLMIASAVTAAFGWRFIRQRRVRVHRRFMLTSSFLGAAFFVSYAVGTLLVGDTAFGGPRQYSAAYQVFLQIHVLLATAAAVLGVITLRYALKGRFPRHRRIAPWTVVFWFISAATGLAVYLLLFVVFPPGPTVGNLWHLLTSSK